MRRSIAALAIIQQEDEGQTLWLARWNRNWNAFSLVGGHKRSDETFEECMIRELNEELGLVSGTDFSVLNPVCRPNFVAWSESAKENTQYIMELFDVQLLDPLVRERVNSDPDNYWLTAHEIRTGSTAAGKPVSQTVEMLLQKLNLLNGSADMVQPAYEPKPFDTASVELPDTILDLIERLAENVHDIWARQRIAEGWTYAGERSDERKEHPCLIPYHDLPETEKEYDRNTATETLKAIIALGYRIKTP